MEKCYINPLPPNSPNLSRFKFFFFFFFHVSNLRVVRNDLEFPRNSANFSEFVILQIIVYLWLL